ncbi:hypothetical protein GCM10009668_33940 [Nocardioides dubius]|uniref:Uncharacterized protein n=1 Tax=Nocardioides dubius TaxID=317019 RepID=A0ABP4EI63_9ACTN
MRASLRLFLPSLRLFLPSLRLFLPTLRLWCASLRSSPPRRRQLVQVPVETGVRAARPVLAAPCTALLVTA